MRKAFILLLALTLLLGAAGIVGAATSADKQLAIDRGLKWLASTQQADGSWSYGGGYYDQAATGAVLLAFADQRYKPLGWNGADYSAVVTNATNYLLTNALSQPLSANWWGFPSTAQTGVKWGTDRAVYVSGIILPALSRLVSNPYGGSPLVSPSAIIGGTGNAVVDGKAYNTVIQQGINTFAWGQTGPAGGNMDGGWRYNPGDNQSDMSTTQWATVSFLMASQVPGVTIPTDAANSMKSHLQTWLGAVQQQPGGGVDYYPGAGIINATHIGGFLLSRAFAGGGGDLASAMSWLNGDWQNTESGTWYGNFGNPYAMFAVYKGLEVNYGTTGAGPISNLHPQGTNLIDPGATWNWWEDYCQWLVDNQIDLGGGEGYWPGYSSWYGPMATAWDINILNATQSGPVVPLPGTLGLLSTGLFGLLGAGWWRRRKA